MKPASFRELARQLGVTDGAIRKAVKSGRIPSKALGTRRTQSGKTQRVIVDPVLAADCFSQNADHSRASVDKPLESGVAGDIAQLRRIREKAKAQLEIAKMQRYVGELINRQIAHQAAASAAHAALNDLRKIVRAKQLTKDALLAAIDACELAILNTIDKRIANATESST
jgi:hypothetical protein